MSNHEKIPKIENVVGQNTPEDNLYTFTIKERMREGATLPEAIAVAKALFPNPAEQASIDKAAEFLRDELSAEQSRLEEEKKNGN